MADGDGLGAVACADGDGALLVAGPVLRSGCAGAADADGDGEGDGDGFGSSDWTGALVGLGFAVAEGDGATDGSGSGSGSFVGAGFGFVEVELLGSGDGSGGAVGFGFAGGAPLGAAAGGDDGAVDWTGSTVGFAAGAAVGGGVGADDGCADGVASAACSADASASAARATCKPGRSGFNNVTARAIATAARVRTIIIALPSNWHDPQVTGSDWTGEWHDLTQGDGAAVPVPEAPPVPRRPSPGAVFPNGFATLLGCTIRQDRAFGGIHSTNSPIHGWGAYLTSQYARTVRGNRMARLAITTG